MKFAHQNTKLAILRSIEAQYSLFWADNFENRNLPIRTYQSQKLTNIHFQITESDIYGIRMNKVNFWGNYYYCLAPPHNHLQVTFTERR
jgi:hypothetical protein